MAPKKKGRRNKTNLKSPSSNAAIPANSAGKGSPSEEGASSTLEKRLREMQEQLQNLKIEREKTQEILKAKEVEVEIQLKKLHKVKEQSNAEPAGEATLEADLKVGEIGDGVAHAEAVGRRPQRERKLPSYLNDFKVD